MKGKKERVFIWLPCKAYTKAWLVKNFSSPTEKWPDAISLSSDKETMAWIKNRLEKPCLRYDKNRMVKNSKYTEKVPIEISMDTFYRCGWELSATDIAALNARFEQRIKGILRSYMELYVSFGKNIAEGIREFYKVTGFSERSWPEESIRRYCFRHCNFQRNNSFINAEINKIFMANMYHK